MKKNDCKICSGATVIIRDKKFQIDYYLCSDCEFIFMDEAAIVPPEQEVARYKEHNNSMENEGYVNMFKEFMKVAVDPYAERIKTALDFGCGPSPVLATLLQQKGFQVDTYDPYFAPEKTYETKCYDLITATEVFEHLQDPLQTAKLLKKHLNSGGILAIMTLFHPGDAASFSSWWYRRDSTHISFFRPRTFTVLAERLGLKVLTFDRKNVCVLTK
ncbi:MAG: class I SAM-dependent methyltransferase [Bacillota bacterium]|nr:class I SAM-dependent methyltransferase [Bacillota bacterium]